MRPIFYKGKLKKLKSDYPGFPSIDFVRGYNNWLKQDLYDDLLGLCHLIDYEQTHK